ncbi:hypothetical protein GQ600_13271 [Phytophthora cactorum]|nr:hypothetical protein GQ600_13271 [Phytophthora cactorum]
MCTTHGGGGVCQLGGGFHVPRRLPKGDSSGLQE